MHQKYYLYLHQYYSNLVLGIFSHADWIVFLQAEKMYICTFIAMYCFVNSHEYGLPFAAIYCNICVPNSLNLIIIYICLIKVPK